MKNAMVHALQTVDANHAGQQQAIHAQGQSLHECHTRLRRLNAKQDALETAIGAVTEAQARLNEAMLFQDLSEMPWLLTMVSNCILGGSENSLHN